MGGGGGWRVGGGQGLTPAGDCRSTRPSLRGTGPESRAGQFQGRADSVDRTVAPVCGDAIMGRVRVGGAGGGGAPPYHRGRPTWVSGSALIRRARSASLSPAKGELPAPFRTLASATVQETVMCGGAKGGGGVAQGLGGWLCSPVAAPIGLSPLNLLL